jgi:hypothetical protein
MVFGLKVGMPSPIIISFVLSVIKQKVFISCYWVCQTLPQHYVNCIFVLVLKQLSQPRPYPLCGREGRMIWRCTPCPPAHSESMFMHFCLIILVGLGIFKLIYYY